MTVSADLSDLGPIIDNQTKKRNEFNQGLTYQIAESMQIHLTGESNSEKQSEIEDLYEKDLNQLEKEVNI